MSVDKNPESAGEKEFQDSAPDSQRPDHAEQAPAPRTAEIDQHERRIRAGNQGKMIAIWSTNASDMLRAGGPDEW